MTGQRIGFLGLGNMGGRMTRRLTGAGHPVLGYDPVKGRAAAAGATEARSVTEVVENSDCILLSLPDSPVIEKVIRGEGGAGGVLAAGRAGQVVVDLSTAAPSSSIALHAELADRGIEFLDAGISGGAAAAERGTLTIMVGGSPAALDSIAWVLEPIAAKVVHMGAPGAGHTTKVLNNFLNAVSLAATAEVMLAAKKAGLDLAQVLEVVNASSGVNFATLNRFPHIIRGDYLEGGLTSALMSKDIDLYVTCLAELGVPSLQAAGPMAAFGLASSLGYRDQISNKVVDALGDLAGGIRLHDTGPGQIGP
ncbi:MAG TPA: NAD(P)-dependent oxidoreductase [Streptosporangiaceae bacterium]|nr:NAD(P)-dependent oxidoreductase [Streptosporangiaceae bacterium]